MMGDSQSLALLRSAIDNGRIDVLRTFLSELQLGSSREFVEVVDKPGSDGSTLLHYVTEKGDIDAVRTLLSSGANPCVQDSHGKTPFQAACQEEIKKVYAHELLQAVSQSKLGRVCQLISSGVPVTCVDEAHIGNTALHWAACFGDETVVRVLCDGGCDVNAQNAKGDTPLHDAVRRGETSVVRRLLACGAEANSRNGTGATCAELAASLASTFNAAQQKNKNDGGSANDLRRSEIARLLNVHVVAQDMQRKRHASTSSIASEQSIISSPSLDAENRRDSNLSKMQRDALNRDHALSFCSVESENRHDLIWPRPQHLIIYAETQASPAVEPLQNGCVDHHNSTAKIGPNRSIFTLPDRKLRVFPLAGSHVTGIELENLWEYFRMPLADLRIALEPEYQVKTSNAERSCGVFCGTFPEIFSQENSYQLKVDSDCIELTAKDELGLWYGIVTLMQCLRLADLYDPATLCLSRMVVKDWPDTKYRGVLIDLTGCRTYTMDTLYKIASDLCRLKANQLLLHFEFRVQDAFSLPYSQKELYRLRQYCAALRLQLVPSLDLNTDEAECGVINEILCKFFDRFSSCASFVHLGTNLSSFFVKNPQFFTKHIPEHVKNVYFSVKNLKTAVINESLKFLPPQCILSAFPGQLEEIDFLSRPVCLKFPNCDAGFLCASPDDVLRNACQVAQLGDRHRVLSVLSCDLVSGCEIVPRSFSLLPESAALGASWNRRHDARRSFYRLPLLVAEHSCGERTVAPLFREIFAVGHLERQLTKLMTKRDATPTAEITGVYSEPHEPVTTLSVFVQLLLNPNFMDLESLTPVAFKKVRLELQKCLQFLNDLKRDLPYNYELALSVAEVQLITELMILASRIGQSLCLIGANPSNKIGYGFVNVGVANLMLTSRTDSANKLLEIRTQFQPAWLSRNLPSTLPNALKIFDNLFKMLLPPDLQQFGEKLL